MKSIKTKILSIYVFLIFLIFLVASVAIFNQYSLGKAVNGLIEANYRSIEASRNMINAIERQDSLELIYIQIENKQCIKDFQENQRNFITWMTKAQDNITENKEKGVLDNISEDYLKYTEFFSSLQHIKSTSGIEEANKYYSNKIYPLFLNIKENSEKLIQINETAMFNSKEEAIKNSKIQIYATAILSLLSILIGLVVAVVFTRKIVNPIRILIEGIHSVKAGSLSQEIYVSTKDEIGDLAVEFNNMTRRLNEYEKSNIRNLISEKNKSLAIVKSISDPIIVTDNNNKIVLVNRSAESLFDLNESEIAGHHFLEFIENRIIFHRIKNISTGVNTEEKDKILELNKNGKKGFYKVTVASISDDSGSVTGVVTVLQDITGIKELENMKSDFVSTVSHELRTPLTSIIMGTELLLEGTLGNINDDQRDIIMAMDEDSKKLLALVNDLLDLSRIESGKIKMNYENINIKEIIKNTVRSFEESAEDKGIKIYCSIPDNLPIINADSNKLVCVMNNLITNALKFTERGGEIKITAAYDRTNIRVTVSDNGIGIPKEYHKIIFEKFVQVDTKSNNNTGAGLGLAISKEFITRHGGEIWVESKPNCGSSFIFTLPV